jgi:hypothetical protein
LHRPKPALDAFLRSQRKLDSVTDETYLQVLTLATHHRNALWLAKSGNVPAGALKAAKLFFRKHTAKGFACFAKPL